MSDDLTKDIEQMRQMCIGPYWIELVERLSAENSHQKFLLSEVENFLHWHTDDLCTCFVASMKGRPCRFHEVIASLKTPQEPSTRSVVEGTHE